MSNALQSREQMLRDLTAPSDDIAGLRAEVERQLREAALEDAAASWRAPFDAQESALSAILAEKAADLIATQAARIEALEAALRPIAAVAAFADARMGAVLPDEWEIDTGLIYGAPPLLWSTLRRAAALLSEPEAKHG